LESVLPLPALPPASVTPVISTLITLVASVTPAVGVNVAVQVVPPSLEVTLLRVPLAMVKSAFVKPVTASLNVKVTPEVSPTVKRLSATTTVAVGCTVPTGWMLDIKRLSIFKLNELPLVAAVITSLDMLAQLDPSMLTNETDRLEPFGEAVCAAIGLALPEMNPSNLIFCVE
jgi:hypothetical protein